MVLGILWYPSNKLMRLELSLLAVDLEMTGRAALTPMLIAVVILSCKSGLGLSMAWSRGGQIQVKSRAAPRGTDRPQAPTVRLND